MWGQLFAHVTLQDIAAFITLVLASIGTYIAVQAVRQAIRARQTQAMMEIMSFVPPGLVNEVRSVLLDPYASRY